MRLVLICVSALLALTACGGGGGTTDSSATPPTASQPAVSPTAASSSAAASVANAKAVAQEEAGRYSAEDYGGAWELWTKEGQQALSKADYKKLHAACPGPGLTYDVENVRIDSPGVAVARLSVAGFKMAYDLKYEDGEWRWQPTDDDMKDYALGVDKMVSKMKAEGSC